MWSNHYGRGVTWCWSAFVFEVLRSSPTQDIVWDTLRACTDMWCLAVEMI